jgi:hypothetical protein
MPHPARCQTSVAPRLPPPAPTISRRRLQDGSLSGGTVRRMSAVVRGPTRRGTSCTSCRSHTSTGRCGRALRGYVESPVSAEAETAARSLEDRVARPPQRRVRPLLFRPPTNLQVRRDPIRARQLVRLDRRRPRDSPYRTGSDRARCQRVWPPISPALRHARVATRGGLVCCDVDTVRAVGRTSISGHRWGSGVVRRKDVVPDLQSAHAAVEVGLFWSVQRHR